MPNIETAEDISNLAFGYMASKALFSALRINLFKHLSEGPKDEGELATAAKLDREPVETLVNALVASGVVERNDDGTLSNVEAAEAFLVPGKPYYFGDYLKYQIDRQMFPVMQHLNDALRGDYDRDVFASYDGLMADPEQAELFSDSQHAGSVGPALTLARKIDLSDRKKLLDVGGGSGAFAITLCEKTPGLKAAVIDFPNIQETAEKYIDEAGLSDRISYLPGSALDVEWPGDQDFVLMSYLFSGVGGEHFETLARRAYEALEPGGLFVIHDFIMNDDRSGPYLTALWSLQHMVFTENHRTMTPSLLTGFLEDSGFEDIEHDVLIPGMTMIVWGRKPA